MPDEASSEPGVDRLGRPVIDPTKNVLNLVEAAMKRQDDLRDAETRHMREIAELRAGYETELRKAESARIDAIRGVDVDAVSRAATVATTAADTLRTQVADTAAAAGTALAAALEPIMKDIADLRRAQYEAQGVKANVGETRLNVGAVLGGISVLLVIVFGVVGLILGAR